MEKCANKDARGNVAMTEPNIAGSKFISQEIAELLFAIECALPKIIAKADRAKQSRSESMQAVGQKLIQGREMA